MIEKIGIGGWAGLHRNRTIALHAFGQLSGEADRDDLKAGFAVAPHGAGLQRDHAEQSEGQQQERDQDLHEREARAAAWHAVRAWQWRSRQMRRTEVAT